MSIIPTVPSLRECCACMHDKKRCDGERPCSACVTKGLHREQCIDSCQFCRETKLICDGQKPCSTCRERQRRCLDIGEATTELSSVVEAVDGVDKETPVVARHLTRIRDACVACRRDNKKCELARPCARCLSRTEECINREKEPKSSKIRCQACRLNKRRCEDKRPCGRCAEDGIECIEIARKGGPGSRVRKACSECRRTKYQCDDERPCKNCVRRGFQCDSPVQDDSNDHAARAAELDRTDLRRGGDSGATTVQDSPAPQMIPDFSQEQQVANLPMTNQALSVDGAQWLMPRVVADSLARYRAISGVEYQRSPTLTDFLEGGSWQSNWTDSVTGRPVAGMPATPAIYAAVGPSAGWYAAAQPNSGDQHLQHAYSSAYYNSLGEEDLDNDIEE